VVTDHLELYGTANCPYTRDMREWLEWNRRDFVEYDVEHDRVALARLREIAGAQRTVPVLVEDGRVIQIGWEGRGCIVSTEPVV
jgi:glutaredoxin